MGLLDMVQGGLAAGAGFMADDIEKQIAMERQQALEEMRQNRAESIRREGRQADFEQDLKNAPQKTEAEIKAATAKKDADLKWKTENADVERSLKTGDLEAEIKFKTEHISDLRKIASITRDPTEAKAAQLRLEAAQMELAEKKDLLARRSNIRGLITAGQSVDVNQPGGEQAKKFYEQKTADARQAEALASGESQRGTLKVLKGEPGEADKLVREDKDGNVSFVTPIEGGKPPPKSGDRPPLGSFEKGGDKASEGDKNKSAAAAPVPEDKRGNVQRRTAEQAQKDADRAKMLEEEKARLAEKRAKEKKDKEDKEKEEAEFRLAGAAGSKAGSARRST